MGEPWENRNFDDRRVSTGKARGGRRRRARVGACDQAPQAQDGERGHPARAQAPSSLHEAVYPAPQEGSRSGTTASQARTPDGYRLSHASFTPSDLPSPSGLAASTLRAFHLAPPPPI